MKRRIVVTGMGAISPVGSGVEAFWKGVRDGMSGVGPVTLFDASDMSSRIAAEVKDFDPTRWISKKDLRHMDRFTQFAIAAADEALEQAGLNSSQVDKSRVGVLIGSGIGGLSTIEEKHNLLLKNGPRRMTPFLIPMILLNMASAHVAMRFGYKGPSSAIATACATGSSPAPDRSALARRTGESSRGSDATSAGTGPGGCARTVKKKDETRTQTTSFMIFDIPVVITGKQPRV